MIPDSQSHMPSGDSLVFKPAKPAVCQSAKAASESFNFIKFPNASKKIGCKMLMVQTQWHGISLPPRPLYEPKNGRNMKKPMAPPTTSFPTGAVAGWTSSAACPGLQRQQCCASIMTSTSIQWVPLLHHSIVLYPSVSHFKNQTFQDRRNNIHYISTSMYILLWSPHIAPLYSKGIWFQFYHSITFYQPFPFTKWCGTPCS